MGIRIGLDIGIASVGWAVVTDNYEILEAGSNLFQAADASQNVDRRSFRQHKRLLRRRRNRSSDFKKLWLKFGNLIPKYKINNQLELRIKGLEQDLTQDELYFVLANMLNHRGISYLDDALDESLSGKSDYAKGISINQKELDANKLPCQIQYERLQKYGQYRGNVEIVNEDSEKITLSNVFTINAYRNEIKLILKRQQQKYSFITEKFISEYFNIFDRKREYYEGPGNELSRTDYGRFTTKIDLETGKYITEDNIFEKLIGKCSVYPDQIRAAGASYTAQEFNVLNDLNNLIINNRKLTMEEKKTIVNTLKTSNSINMRKIIKNVIGEDIETMTGARIDKQDKEIFHQFEQYNKMRKELEKIGVDINTFSREELDKFGEILTINTEKDSIIKAFDKLGKNYNIDVINCFIDIRKKNGSMFNKWQSFSLLIMEELIPELYEQAKNQMQLLTDMGVFKSKNELFKECSKIPKDIITEEIYNPVVKRSIRVTVDIVNALIKKYGYPSQIVIEMPRDKNDEEKKKREKEVQARNEKELKDILTKVKKDYGREITDVDFRKHKKLTMKLKLWNEQEGRCPYSGKRIDINDLLDDPNMFEIDHIIPRSISFDDSRNNKTLVYATENQKKSNKTPYMYLKDIDRDWDFHEMMSYVLDLESRKNISKIKVKNYLLLDDITKIDVVKGFVARNINDTRYASRVVLNTLQDYFKHKSCDTKVKVVRGSFTHQMRNNLRLEKSREESYSHHAVDAMLICYSQMGYEAYRKVQEDIIDFEQEVITDGNKWNNIINDDTLDDVMYKERLHIMRNAIVEAEKKVKYWHKVDKKPNRGICNQTIRGTRNIDGEILKINKLNLFDKAGLSTFKKIIEKNQENRLLVYRNDPKTFENIMSIYREYSDATNPFAEYEKITGDYVRKYAKKHNGPRIKILKYTDGIVNSCIDISHKYGYEKDSKKVILESLKPYRMDVYYNKNDKKYYFVGIKYSDCKYINGKYEIDMDAYNKALIMEKLIVENENRDDFIKKGNEYMFSLYKNDIIEYEKDNEIYVERFLSRTMPQKRNYIETKPLDAPIFCNGSRNVIGLSKTKSIRKIRLDILGNKYYAEKEKFKLTIDNI